MSEELSAYLEALDRDSCYRVDEVLKESPFEETQRVYFAGSSGAEQGPFVRKYIDVESGLGSIYERIWQAQQKGKRFLYLPHLIDYYSIDNKRVVIMEYLDGETLADAIYRLDPSVKFTCEVFPRICDAVSELHEQFKPPIIHRDLKPSNIMLTHDNLTIIDFGIARSYNKDAEEDTRRFGTKAYAPPEQFGFGQTDVRSDVYALGMILYFCLTETIPDAEARSHEFREKRVPEEIRLVIERAVAFDPNDRYSSARELKQAFLMATGLLLGTNEDNSTSSAIRVNKEGHADAVGPKNIVAPSFSGKSKKDKSTRTQKRICREPHTHAGRLLARIPFWVGLIWDILLLLVFVFMFVTQIGTVTRNTLTESQPLASTLWAYTLLDAIVILLIIGPFMYLLTDRRPIACLIPQIARGSFARDVVICLVIWVVAFIAFGIVRMFT